MGKKNLELTIVRGKPDPGREEEIKRADELPSVHIRLKHTVVTVLPDGLAMMVKMGREVEAKRVEVDGELKIYVVTGTSGIPRIVPAECAEEIAPPVLN
jgi:hypothetical protein